MMAFSLWKNLKKHLRRKRRPTWSLGGLIPVLTIIGCLTGTPQHANADYEPNFAERQALAEEEGDERRKQIAGLERQSAPLTVKLHRIYVCGEETKPLGRISGKQLASLLRSHPDWTVRRDETPQTLIIEQQIDDLSEQCKANAYIGVDKAGRLSLYDGLPKKEKVVKTFFQLDVQYMESSLPQDKLDRLVKGIRISDMEALNSVMSTYSDFAIEPNEKVMKPQG